MYARILSFYILFVFIISSALAQSPPFQYDNNLIATVGDNPLTTLFSWEGNIGVSIAARSFNCRPQISGTFVLSDIPEGSKLVKAYFAIVGWQMDYTDAWGMFDGNELDTIPPTNYDQDVELYYLSMYRWDVSSMISGNRSYPFRGSNLNFSYLAYLVVIYENTLLPLTSITINDGAESLRDSYSTTLLRSTLTGDGVIKIISQAGEVPPDSNESIEFNGDMMDGPYAVFTGNMGGYADYHQFALTDVENINSLTITTGEDWIGIHLAVLVCPGYLTDADENTNLPADFLVLDNYPNPFNASTAIEYQLQRSADVKIEIYNILGRKVATLIDMNQSPGYHRAIWNANGFSSGVYFYKIQADDLTQSKKMLLLK